MSAVLIVASIVVAVISGLGENLKILTWLTLADLRGFDRTVASGFSAIQQGEVWRLITPIFIHFGLVHIVFNMLWMKDLGPLIERRWSSRTLLTLVLVSAVLSNVAQFLMNWDFKNGVRYANALSGGMSGVVYGLFGYVWIRGRFDPTFSDGLHKTTVNMMLAWFVLCWTGLLGPIATRVARNGMRRDLARLRALLEGAG